MPDSTVGEREANIDGQSVDDEDVMRPVQVDPVPDGSTQPDALVVEQ